MQIISDISSYLIEDTFRKKGLIVSEIINFPCVFSNLEIYDDEIFVLIGETFYREFSKEGNKNQIKKYSYEILNILKKGINDLLVKNNIIFISLVPTHFLFSDKESSQYLKNGSIDSFIVEINQEIINIFCSKENVFFIEGIKHINEKISKDYFRYSSFLNKPNCEILANQIILKKHRINLPKKKLIICDLDNTLWKGVVGDDNISGIKMDPSDPIGKIFHHVQKILLKFKNKGFLIAICSKNEAEAALKALFNHESSLIKENDIVTHRINWSSKSANIKSICDELDLSFKETVFIDDSDYECDEVIKNCPNISIFKVPKDIYSYPYLLKESSLFESNLATNEDKERTILYKQRSERKKLIKKSLNNSDLSKNSWVESLNTVLKIEIIDENSAYIERIVQLFNRTNQFNLKGSKFTIQSLKKKINSPEYLFYYGTAKDRIGSEGLISAIGIKRTDSYIQIIDYILSCRIFGRFIEESMLIPALDIANQNNLGINFKNKDTGRNKISQNFVNDLCGKSLQNIEKEKISSIIKKFAELPVKLEINKNLYNQFNNIRAQ